jgi:hypothetical protein
VKYKKIRKDAINPGASRSCFCNFFGRHSVIIFFTGFIKILKRVSNFYAVKGAYNKNSYTFSQTTIF